MIEKYCKSCGETKSIDLFGVDRSKKSGIRYRCRACDAASTSEYRKTFPEKVAAATAAWLTENKEQVSETRKKYRSTRKDHYSKLHSEWVARNKDRHESVSAAWREANKDWLAAYSKKLRESDPARFAAALREWQKSNPEKVNALNARRRAARLNANVSWADKRKISRIYKKAVELTKETGIPHHVDHIVPLQSKIVCGLHCDANLQVMTASENMSKHNKYWPDMPR